MRYTVLGARGLEMPVTAVYVLRKDDPEALGLLSRLRRSGAQKLEKVVIERVYWLEGEIDPPKLFPALVNPLYETASLRSRLDPKLGLIIEIGYQPAVTDPETASILEAASALGCEGLTWVRLTTRYQFTGVSRGAAEELAKEFLFNPVVQMIIPPDYQFASLRPCGEPKPVTVISLKGLSDEELQTLSRERSWYAPLSQMKALQDYEERLGRPLTDAEIEIVVQSWCDHCYHTTWKSLGLLPRLMEATHRINHPLVVSAFTDNAGGMRFYDDWALIIKGETHNFPTSIAPFGGVATKHGGVIRDVIGFGKGGYPIGGTTIMGTMDSRISTKEVPAGALHPAHIVRESVRATAYYLNPMGVPMMHPSYRTHPGYPKCFALGHSLGIIPEKYALKEDPRPGDVILLIGGRTGRDGIHGATASSTGVSRETFEKEGAAVQIGHPVVERKFATAIPELRNAGCIRSITDLGAGGISCAAGEMGAKTGVTINLEAVPLKDESLSPWEILLSESQERMFLVIPKAKLKAAQKILGRYGVESAVIGQFTDTKHLVATYRGETIVDLEMSFLWGGCPIDSVATRKLRRKLKPVQVKEPKSGEEWKRRIKAVLGHDHCCDQSSAGFQFDSTIQGRTVIGPYGGGDGRMPQDVFVSAPLRGKPYGVVFTASFNPFWGEVSPEGLARLAMAEAITKAVAVGVNPGEIVLCDNFYTPRIRPEVAWDLKCAVEAISDFSIALGVPFISGKDSSSGTFTAEDGETVEVPFTLVAAAMGRVPDVRRLVTKPFKEPGNNLVLVGRYEADRLGGSVYLDCFGERGKQLPDFGPQWSKELLTIWKRLHSICQQDKNPIFSASAIGEGGLLLRLFEMSFGGGLGVGVDLAPFRKMRRDEALFSEMVGAALLEVAPEADLEKLFAGVPWRLIGQTTREPLLRVSDGADLLIEIPIAELVEVWEKPFAELGV